MTAALPLNMRQKIVFELSPVGGLAGFCWTWSAALNSRGYGCVAVDGKSQLAHRYSYEQHCGPIPAGLQIDHLCGNKRCCNPAHLEAVTAKVNMSRTDRVRKSHCIHGHLLSDDNVIVKKAGKYTIRNCRECVNRRQREARSSA